MAPCGTFGDVAPLLTYAHQLKSEGHEVHFIITTDFKSLIQKNGFFCTEIPFNFTEFSNHNILLVGQPFMAFFHFKKDINRIVNICFESIKDIAIQFDLIIGSGLQFAAFSWAESMNIPYQHLLHAPVWISSKYHSPPFIKKQFRSTLLNKILWKLFIFVINSFLKKELNKQRLSLGLLPLKNIYAHFQRYIHISCSQDIIALPELGLLNKQIPYFFPITDVVIPKYLSAFLKTEKHMIYVGFGSMPIPNMDFIIGVLSELVGELGIKCIFQVNEGEYVEEYQSEDIFFLQERVSHADLFKKVDFIIHHGGAGTVHQAFKAEKPQMIIPCMLDQFYWASIIEKKELGVQSIFLNNLTRERLKDKIISGLEVNMTK